MTERAPRVALFQIEGNETDYYAEAYTWREGRRYRIAKRLRLHHLRRPYTVVFLN